MGQEFESGLLRPFWLWSLIWLESNISCGFSHGVLTGLADVLPRWLKFVPPHGTSPLLSVLTAWQLSSFRLSKWRGHYRNWHAFSFPPLDNHTLSLLPYSVGHTGPPWLNAGRALTTYTRLWHQEAGITGGQLRGWLPHLLAILQ